MKVNFPDLKIVRNLTKYISPAEIEHLRYKKYNAPIINDGNLLCDEFFRTEEVFNRKSDEIKSFQPYSIDDLPVYDRTTIKAFDKRRLLGDVSYVETDLPYYVDIIGENKRIYLESYGVKNPKYPGEVSADGKYKGFRLDDVVNIKYYARKLSPNNIIGIEEEALQMIKDGFPLESVINIMEESALKSKYGTTRGARGLMPFLLQFPKLRHLVVSKSKFGIEVFDYKAAKAFPELVDMCNGDTEIACKIVQSCKIKQDNESLIINTDMLDLAKKLYEADNSWSQSQQEIMSFIKRKYPLRHIILMTHANTCLEKGMPVSSIYHELVLRLNKRK